ncbi:hypothetical protein M422DRAFT_49491 [Sphaerobolus stellatus SS14]|uniref:Uncharacterized protein n=1 Tax=Sphaerobolus stellatus (strain SS14) TaxID=990650 RepID=A0A0C9VPJ6_SPHS4|nr:hypothetical protein M422DRAFT_49491 [Sphaerobolus stellatus SS14]
MSMRQPMAGSKRVSKPRRTKHTKDSTNSTQDAPNFSLQPSGSVAPSRQTRGGPRLPSTPRKGAILAMPFGQTFVQSRNLPLQGVLSGIAQLVKKKPVPNDAPPMISSPPGSPEVDVFTGGVDDTWGINMEVISEHQEVLNKQAMKAYNQARYQRKKTNQYQR